MKLTDIVKHEVVYDSKVFASIKARWPDAKQLDARDMIHLNRITVQILSATYEEFYSHALDNGYSDLLLSFQFNMLDFNNRCPGFISLVKEWIEDNPT